MNYRNQSIPVKQVQVGGKPYEWYIREVGTQGVILNQKEYPTGPQVRAFLEEIGAKSYEVDYR